MSKAIEAEKTTYNPASIWEVNFDTDTKVFITGKQMQAIKEKMLSSDDEIIFLDTLIISVSHIVSTRQVLTELELLEMVSEFLQ